MDADPSHAHIIALYRRHADAWATRRSDHARLEAGWLERFAALLPPRAEVLDIGCAHGTPIADWLVEGGCAVTGVDTSGPLLARARARLPGQTWIEADMRTLDLGRRFDGLIAWDSFFHLAPGDQRGMFDRFAAHARPGAPLLFTSGPAAGEALGTFEGQTLYHASLSPDEYRSLLQQHGFEVVQHVAEDASCGHHTVWLARMAAG